MREELEQHVDERSFITKVDMLNNQNQEICESLVQQLIQELQLTRDARENLDSIHSEEGQLFVKELNKVLIMVKHTLVGLRDATNDNSNKTTAESLAIHMLNSINKISDERIKISN